jgi:hypothetical protein
MTPWLDSFTDIWVPAAVLMLPDAAMAQPWSKLHDHKVFSTTESYKVGCCYRLLRKTLSEVLWNEKGATLLSAGRIVRCGSRWCNVRW